MHLLALEPTMMWSLSRAITAALSWVSIAILLTLVMFYDKRSIAVFEGFKHLQVQTTDPEVKINLRYGG